VVFSKVQVKPGDEDCSSSDSESYAGGSIATGRVTQPYSSQHGSQSLTTGGRKDSLGICQPRKECKPQNQSLVLQSGGWDMRWPHPGKNEDVDKPRPNLGVVLQKKREEVEKKEEEEEEKKDEEKREEKDEEKVEKRDEEKEEKKEKNKEEKQEEEKEEEYEEEGEEEEEK